MPSRSMWMGRAQAARQRALPATPEQTQTVLIATGSAQPVAEQERRDPPVHTRAPRAYWRLSR